MRKIDGGGDVVADDAAHDGALHPVRGGPAERTDRNHTQRGQYRQRESTAYFMPIPNGGPRTAVNRQRLEAFTDAVVAIIITILVLGLKVPGGSNLTALRAALPTLLAYALAFAVISAWWNNHHHMLHVTERINGMVLWANLFFLFWLSLIPYVIRWMDETSFAAMPTAAFGVVQGLAAIALILLQRAIVVCNGPNSQLARAIGSDLKGKLSLLIWALSIPLAFVHPGIALTLYVVVVLMWLIPDRRIESIV